MRYSFFLNLARIAKVSHPVIFNGILSNCITSAISMATPPPSADSFLARISYTSLYPGKMSSGGGALLHQISVRAINVHFCLRSWSVACSCVQCAYRLLMF
eukprot:Pompholyxophrys_punicea_v1_NODE_31_length_5106_cov_5.948276.p4 type:complete len:101 gc:universal NODE_31_length_5106_cov_5.948276:3755-4057(+)